MNKFRCNNCIFDETGHFLLYATMLGIKVINLYTNRSASIIACLVFVVRSWKFFTIMRKPASKLTVPKILLFSFDYTCKVWPHKVFLQIFWQPDA